MSVLAKEARADLLISLIIPVHNEEAAIGPYLEAVNNETAQMVHDGYHFEFVFINDGSTDTTLDQLIRSQEEDTRIRILDLSRNFGKEAAMTAGLDACRGDAAIPIDVDLQDPPSLIPVLVAHWRQGFEVVLARRRDRFSDSFLKRKTAAIFYKLLNLIAAQAIPRDVGDFRLVDRQVIDALKKLPERRRFMKGIFAWVGFKTAIVDYTRAPRSSGNTKFSGWRLWNFALEGITSFSSFPLEIWTYVGAMISFFSFGYGTVTILKTMYFGIDVPGYASLLVSMLFLGGIQLMGIGILGQYLGRVYAEIKQRPIYLVRKDYRSSTRHGSDNLIAMTPKPPRAYSAKSARRSGNRMPVQG